VDRQTRHELKTDKFVEEVGHTVEFIEHHRSQVIRYSSIGVAVVLVAAGYWFYSNNAKVKRQVMLGEAIQFVNSPVGSAAPGAANFPTQEAKDKAVDKAFNDIITTYSGSDESGVAMYMLGVGAADKGKLADAERLLRQATKEAGKEHASLARLALADVLVANGKAAEAETELRSLIANPTVMVSKEQSTLSLARVLAKTKPAEARKLLDPMRGVSGPASASAIALMAELGL
jgi:predicted negative regulator of RcsB-dependent stress response